MKPLRFVGKEQGTITYEEFTYIDKQVVETVKPRLIARRVFAKTPLSDAGWMQVKYYKETDMSCATIDMYGETESKDKVVKTPSTLPIPIIHKLILGIKLYVLLVTMTKKADCAYSAGFIDGEAWVGMAKRRQRGNRIQYTVQIVIGNTNREVIEWLQKLWGGYINIRKRKSQWKNCYVLILSAQQALAMAKEIMPYVKVKQLQVKLLLEVYEKGIIKPSYWTFDSRRDAETGQFISKTVEESEEYYAAQEAYYQQFKVLNKTGDHE